MRPRLHIGRLIAVIALCGVGLAAFRSPSNLWASTLFTVSAAILVAALLNLAVCRGRSRAYWLGFAVCGWAYFAANFAPWAAESVGPRLVTTALLDILYPSIAPPSPPPAPGGWTGGGTVMMNPMGGMTAGYPGMGGPGGAVPPVPSRWEVWTMDDRNTGIGMLAGSVVMASPETFRRIGHSLLTPLLAALGGWHARSRFDRRGREDAVPSPARA